MRPDSWAFRGALGTLAGQAGPWCRHQAHALRPLKGWRRVCTGWGPPPPPDEPPTLLRLVAAMPVVSICVQRTEASMWVCSEGLHAGLRARPEPRLAASAPATMKRTASSTLWELS